MGGIDALPAVVHAYTDQPLDNPLLDANLLINEAHHRVCRTGLEYVVAEQVCQATCGPGRSMSRSMYASYVLLALGERWTTCWKFSAKL